MSQNGRNTTAKIKIRPMTRQISMTKFSNYDQSLKTTFQQSDQSNIPLHQIQKTPSSQQHLKSGRHIFHHQRYNSEMKAITEGVICPQESIAIKQEANSKQNFGDNAILQKQLQQSSHLPPKIQQLSIMEQLKNLQVHYFKPSTAVRKPSNKKEEQEEDNGFQQISCFKCDEDNSVRAQTACKIGSSNNNKFKPLNNLISDQGEQKQQLQQNLAIQHTIKQSPSQLRQIKKFSLYNAFLLQNNKVQDIFDAKRFLSGSDSIHIFCKRFYENLQLEVKKMFKADQGKVEQTFQEMLKNSQGLIEETYLLINQAVGCYKNTEMLDKIFQQVMAVASQYKINYFIVLNSKAYAKIFYIYRDFIKTINLLKNSKHIAQFNGFIRQKLCSYRLIGLSFIELKKYKTALKYFIKYLRVSWFLGDITNELKAYDLIGVAFYYLGDMQRAHFYHQKMVNGEFEKEEEIKKLSNSKLSGRLYSNNPYGVTEKKKIKLLDSRQLKMQNDNQEFDPEIDLISSSDDEFELPPPIKRNNSCYIIPLTSDSQNQQQFRDNWSQKAIQARVNRIMNERDKNAAQLEQKIGTISIQTESFENQKYNLHLSRKHAISKVNEKQRISHLTPNKYVLNYHQFEEKFLSHKNYDGLETFIPTVDGVNSNKVYKKLIGYSDKLKFLAQSIQVNETKQQNNADIKKQGNNRKPGFLVQGDQRQHLLQQK